MKLKLPGIICAAAGGAALALGQALAWWYAPVEAIMGLPQKILYGHVPLAWWSLIAFLLAAVAGALYLRSRKPFWDHLGLAAVQSGVVLAGLTLLTGMIWGKYAWGVWWTGDPRLTTFLVLWFMYAGCLMLRGTGLAPGPEQGRRAALFAAMSIIACINVPLVFLSTRLLRSAHPVVLGKQGGGLEPEMLLTLLVCLAGMGLLWLGGVLLRLHLAQLREACARLEYTHLLRPAAITPTMDNAATEATTGAAGHD